MCGTGSDRSFFGEDQSPDPAHQLTKTFSLNPKSITMEEPRSRRATTGMGGGGADSAAVQKRSPTGGDGRRGTEPRWMVTTTEGGGGMFGR